MPTRELLTEQLSNQQISAHPNPVHKGRGGVGNVGRGGQAAKIDKKIRPSISPQMTEESWRFFLDEWARYKQYTGVRDQSLLDELWSCMSDELRQLAFA